jgi:hypothetical protein
MMPCPHCPHCTRPAARPRSVYEIKCESCGREFTTHFDMGYCPHCGSDFVIVFGLFMLRKDLRGGLPLWRMRPRGSPGPEQNQKITSCVIPLVGMFTLLAYP